MSTKCLEMPPTSHLYLGLMQQYMIEHIVQPTSLTPDFIPMSLPAPLLHAPPEVAHLVRHAGPGLPSAPPIPFDGFVSSYLLHNAQWRNYRP